MTVAAAKPPPPSATQSKPAEREIRKLVLPGQAPDAKYIFSVLVKRTYDIVLGGRCTRAAQDAKLVAGDTHYDGPANSPVKFESDLCPFKLATDVVLHVKAYAPGGKPVPSLVASVLVGTQRKDILVIGDRVARFQSGKEPAFTEPQPFVSMDLRYDRAYGGIDIYSDTKMPAMYPRNHLGRGYVVANKEKSVDKLALPNLEDPNDRLTPARLCVGHFKDWERQPMPQGLGWVMKAWRPRCMLAGVMPCDKPAEKELRAAYATLVPPAQKALFDQTQIRDMDFKFFNGASQGLVFPYLSGEERIRLMNLHRSGGDVNFQLPGERPRMSLDIGNGAQSPPVVLHTVMIRVEENQVDLVWRGAVPYPGPDWLPQMKKMEAVVE